MIHVWPWDQRHRDRLSSLAETVERLNEPVFLERGKTTAWGARLMRDHGYAVSA